MNTTTTLSRAAPPLAARAVLKSLERLAHGRLQLRLPDGATLDFGPGGAAAEIEVRDWRAFSRILVSGDIGFAEGWIDGDWTSADPAALLCLLGRNRAALDGAIYGSWIGRTAHGLLHALRANTRRGARRNIAAHYDLGNDFYRLWLDPGMTYSSALFEGDATRSLGEAQTAKLERILQRLAVPAGSHVLEIGCGWGSFAEHAAQRGLRVSGITLSREQLAYAPGSATTCASNCATTATCTRVTTPWSRSKCWRPWASAGGRRTSTGSRPACRAAGAHWCSRS
jgi:cyclopropane-fatty-acyl-phospholipid synthase